MPDLAQHEIQCGAGVVSQAWHDPTDAAAWVIQAGLAGVPELDLLRGFCERAVATGLPIGRAQVLVDTLHPIHEGRVFRWQADRVGELVEYGRTSENDTLADKWRQSPFHHLEQTGETWLRRKLAGNGPADFPILAELRAQGHTDYLACAHRFAGDGVIGAMDCIYSSWTPARIRSKSSHRRRDDAGRPLAWAAGVRLGSGCALNSSESGLHKPLLCIGLARAVRHRP